MTTAGHGRTNGTAYWVCTSAAPRAAEQPRQRPEHPQLLDRRPEHERLDPGRDELGMSRGRRDPQAGVAGERSKLAQKVAHVRLVAGAMPAEHVRVDDDERLAHASAPR